MKFIYSDISYSGLICVITLLSLLVTSVDGWWFFKRNCKHKGHTYPVDAKFGLYYDARVNKCFEYTCTAFGKLVFETHRNCHPPTPPPTTTPPTTTPKGCYYNGVLYEPGMQISKGQSGNWCYETYCDQDGNLISGDDWNCGSTPLTTPSPSTSTPPTRRPTTTPPYGDMCKYDDNYYPANSEITSGKEGTWCWAVYCDHNGDIIHADDFHCSTTTVPTTTMPPTTSPYPSNSARIIKHLKRSPPTTPQRPTTEQSTEATTRAGCESGGVYYPVGATISSSRLGKWCYFTVCGDSGHLIAGHGICGDVTTTTPTQTTTSFVMSRLLRLIEKTIRS